jgi:hypothetical protein
MRVWIAASTGGWCEIGPANFVTRTPGVTPGRFALLQGLIEHSGEARDDDALGTGPLEGADAGV